MEIATNRQAWHDFEILERFEAGIVLPGLEVKKFRARQVALAGTYAKVIGGEVYWLGQDFKRKLLLHRQEINRLIGRTVEKGLTLVPLRVYFQRGQAKVELALARHKKKWDQRQTLKQRELELERRSLL